MTSIQPELWVDAPREALAFYEAAFGATVLHRVGEGEDPVGHEWEIGAPLGTWPPPWAGSGGALTGREARLSEGWRPRDGLFVLSGSLEGPQGLRALAGAAGTLRRYVSRRKIGRAHV